MLFLSQYSVAKEVLCRDKNAFHKKIKSLTQVRVSKCMRYNSGCYQFLELMTPIM